MFIVRWAESHSKQPHANVVSKASARTMMLRSRRSTAVSVDTRVTNLRGDPGLPKPLCDAGCYLNSILTDHRRFPRAVGAVRRPTTPLQIYCQLKNKN
jgi:hypothetical protein